MLFCVFSKGETADPTAIESPRIPQNPLESLRIPVIPRNPTESHGIPRNPTESHGIFGISESQILLFPPWCFRYLCLGPAHIP